MRFSFQQHQVFLNYPFDQDSEAVSMAMHFAVVAAGLLPVCAWDLTSPDRPRLEMLVDTISSCQYSAHDFSRCRGEGIENFARFNMPVEMGMALFYALQTQRAGHRCAFFVTTPNDYKVFASDFAGLDPLVYDSEIALLLRMYEWLRDTAHAALIPKASAEIHDVYLEFKERSKRVRGSGVNGKPTHHEAQELMYLTATEHELWDWRANKAGQLAFPKVPLSWVDRKE
jgi:hypothetical protein